MMRENVIKAARKLAKEQGAVNLTRKSVCAAAGIPEGSFKSIMGESFTDFLIGLDLDVTAKSTTTTRGNMNGEMRKKHILACAIKLSETEGYLNVTAKQVGEMANVSHALVLNYFKSMPELRRAIMRNAVAQGNATVVLQGLVIKDKYALAAPDELKQKALASL